MHSCAVRLERGLALLAHARAEIAAEQSFAGAAGKRAERVIDESDAAFSVAADDEIALRVEQALGALLTLLELPIAVR